MQEIEETAVTKISLLRYLESACVVVDLEVVPPKKGQVSEVFLVGAFRPDTDTTLETPTKAPEVKEALQKIGEGASVVLGHNIDVHDLPLMRQEWPTLKMLELPSIDTLRLSPLAFPQNPYHRLLKDYKLIRESLNSPLADCLATWSLFQDQLNALTILHEQKPAELEIYQALLARAGNSALDKLLGGLTGTVAKSLPEAGQLIREVLIEKDPTLARKYKVCITRLEQLVVSNIYDTALAWPIAYALAWLRVSGGNSVMPPWVRHQYPETIQLVKELRDIPCGDPQCTYCQTTHDPRNELRTYFGFDDFRYESPGVSAQFNIVLAGMRGDSVLAVLATGGGKSLCYQLPALNRYHRNGSLTVIVSPLQSLMKDQVDGLLARGVQCAAALNGLLTMPERADILEKIQLGDIGILLVSPEQFRNKAFKSAISQRQIGAWIFDEAHCLSKWGNDFRPDYLYVSKFIKKLSVNAPLAPIGCFTATGKVDVLDDIKAHFSSELGLQFKEFIGTPERTNLQFEAYLINKAEKAQRIHTLMTDELRGKSGGCVVFVSSRKRAEKLSEFLSRQDWRCRFFHAGLPPSEKKEIQEEFIKGGLQAIVATNAFGMGVDKPDVRLVIHADIPGSLENYLQEAGRAGRDQEAARCVLLYCPDDIEEQFGQSERSRLSIRDIQQILKKLRNESKRKQNADLVITAGEILNDQTVHTSFEADDRDADTKVVTALAWLERGEFLEREDNHTRIFPAKLRLSKEQAHAKLERASLSVRRRSTLEAILNFMYEAKTDQRISTDQLMQLTGLSSEEVAQLLKQLETLELLENDTQLTVYVRAGVKNHSAIRLAQSLELETALFEEMRVTSPDADNGEWVDVHLPTLTQRLKQITQNDALLPLHVNRLLKSLAQDRDGESQQRSSLELKQITRELLKLRIRSNYSWGQVVRQGDRRRKLAQVIVPFLLGKLDPKVHGADLIVNTTIGELKDCIAGDLELSSLIKLTDYVAAINHVLLYLHQQEVVQLNHGMTVMRRAMTIKVNKDRVGQRYTREEYSRLEDHYDERRVQVHVIREYAEVGINEMADALRLVMDYFTLDKSAFMQRYFRGRAGLLKYATSETSWKKITQNLNAQQKKVVVEDLDQNRLILAGPGSGKTRVVVHRIAYLLRVRRVPASAIIALTFNRHAAIEIRKRLSELVGNDAIGVTVLTYHAMAMRLTGTTFEQREAVTEQELEGLLDKAAELLEEGTLESGDGEDDQRDKLMQGYQYILVDEYQDIDQRQYRLVSALAKRKDSAEDKDGDLCILAVGDDDQNIYAFRGGSNLHIQNFQEEFGADICYLIENYRSSKAIIQTSNALIENNHARLKNEHPIKIDEARDDDVFGGRWHALDPIRKGEVLRLQIDEVDRGRGNLQAQAAMLELKRLFSIDPNASWSECAVLARSHRYLSTVQAWCELHQIPYYLAAAKERNVPLTRTRQFLSLVDAVRSRKEDQLLPRDLQLLLCSIELSSYWEDVLGTACEQLQSEFGDCELAKQSIIDWLYDFAREIRSKPQAGIFLGTVHAAKGLEFEHVVVLDGAWESSQQELEENRRLYYVAMTRAKGTLTLCEFGAGNVFSSSLGEKTKSQNFAGKPIPELGVEYVNLSLRDVDLSYAGRSSKNARIHEAMRALKPRDPLEFRYESNCWILLSNGVPVGRTSKKYTLSFQPSRCEVHQICHWFKTDSGEEFWPQLQHDRWEVVVPRFVS